jgi:CRP/FNR family cyclic AMP-dependent transcriptional regulator
MQLTVDVEKGHSRLPHINRFNLLQGMSEGDVQRVVAMTRITRRQRGDLIYLAGDVSSRVYFLKGGRIKLTGQSEDGHEVLLDLIGPGEMFGEVGAIQETPRTTSAQAVEDALLFEMDRHDFESLVLSYPEIALRVLKRVALRLKRAEAQLVRVICKDVPTRVREALVDLMDDGSVSKPKPPVKIGLTQQDIANLIGASRQETARALKELKDSGVLDLKYRRIVVKAPDLLRQGRSAED